MVEKNFNPSRTARVLATAKALVWTGAATLLGAAAWALHSAGAAERDLPAWIPHQVFEAGLALALSWVFLRLEGRRLRSIGLVPDRRWLRQFAWGAALGGAIILAAALVSALFGGVRWRPGSPALAALLPGAWLYLAVAWSEELHFRGYAFQRLCEGIGPWPAQLLFAAWFVLAHWENPGMAGATRIWAALNIGLAALLLGAAWLRTGSLAASIGLHLGWNFVQGPLLGFGVSGTHSAAILRPELPPGGAWLHGGAFGLEAGLPCALAATAAWILLVRWTRPGAMLGTAQEEPCPDGS